MGLVEGRVRFTFQLDYSHTINPLNNHKTTANSLALRMGHVLVQSICQNQLHQKVIPRIMRLLIFDFFKPCHANKIKI